MPIRGFPDPKKHKHCYYCKRWHEPDEGRMIAPERANIGGEVFLPLHLARGYREAVEGPDLYFACFRCLKRRWLSKVALWVALGGILALLGILKLVR